MFHLIDIISAWFNGQYDFADLFCSLKVIHKEDSRFLNQFYPTPCLYHELNMIIHTSYISI